MGHWAGLLRPGELLEPGGALGPTVGAPSCRAFHVLLSPAVLADDVLLVTDDRGADTGHVQWTPFGPLRKQPWSPKTGHYQWDGGS